MAEESELWQHYHNKTKSMAEYVCGKNASTRVIWHPLHMFWTLCKLHMSMQKLGGLEMREEREHI